MRRSLLFLLLLAGCAPQATQRPVTAFLSGPVSFYPDQTGLQWTYEPQGALPDAPPYTLTVEGPGVVHGVPVILFRFTGRGQDRIYYRAIGPQGVQLLGFDERITESKVRFNPPLLEYPPPQDLTVGAQWGGTSELTSVIELPDHTYTTDHQELHYTYTVVSQSAVEVPAGRFEAYHIHLTLTSQGQTLD
jgi:hypothetical protein